MMYQAFLNARSPVRLLEKGLHGGLGRGNLGLVLAGHGVGKTAFLVGIALDVLMRGGHVLHVSLDHSVAHVRAYYDTVFDDLAASTRLEREALVHADIDRHRSIRSYGPTSFGPGKLAEAIKVETETGPAPGLVILEGRNVAHGSVAELQDYRALAQEIDAEIWLSSALAGEQLSDIPDAIQVRIDEVSVALALLPDRDAVSLQVLKDHNNPDLSELHVHLDPKTLLLARG